VTDAALRSMTPVPTDEEAAAIVAAVEHLWPQTVLVVADEPPARAAEWRFSGRWWTKPVATRRVRPWM
jgi:hypothetical protein